MSLCSGDTIQHGRIEKFGSLVDLGYDVKDFLLQQMHVDDTVDDVLARRYYSRKALCLVHRDAAVKVWQKIGSDSQLRLERTLTAYDMFVLGDREGDFDEVAFRLDTLAQELLELHPSWENLTCRDKASTLVRFLRANRYTGVRPGGTYHEVPNSLISFVLLHPDHQSLPLTLVAIFCAVAARLGLDARPCGYPFHIYAKVYPPVSATVDGARTESGSPSEPVFLDPFRSEDEVPLEDLHQRMTTMGVPTSAHTAYLRDASLREMTLRNGRNILQSARSEAAATAATGQGQSPFESSEILLEEATYSALWGTLIIHGVPDVGAERTQSLHHLAAMLASKNPEDVWLVEHHLLGGSGVARHPHLLAVVNLVRQKDASTRRPKRRDPDVLQKPIRYHVGQVFKHRRYAYHAVVTGWDIQCEAGEGWIREMQVDQLSGGRQQCFYQVLVDDGSERYVAEENIHVIILNSAPARLLPLAGKYFKRWDQATGTFVSNVRDEFPDD
ncbi:MAG: hypothetical protein M1838_001503 [Thelocarpon superellum]|nr:MAG: hypothetical protein M1838_001503 [Thelocarpon superellum]